MYRCSDEGEDVALEERLNFINILYYYVQRVYWLSLARIATLYTMKAPLLPEIVLSNQHQERHHCSKTTKLGKGRMENSKN